ncbi:hypothetical protein OS493_040453, partial [Desmophyllum pertusum]
MALESSATDSKDFNCFLGAVAIFNVEDVVGKVLPCGGPITSGQSTDNGEETVWVRQKRLVNFKAG